jgi:hypothetical protein
MQMQTRRGGWFCGPAAVALGLPGRRVVTGAPPAAPNRCDGQSMVLQPSLGAGTYSYGLRPRSAGRVGTREISGASTSAPMVAALPANLLAW